MGLWHTTIVAAFLKAEKGHRLKTSFTNFRSKMERRNWEVHGGRLSDKMAVKRLNAMGIEAKSWYDKGKESKSDMSSQAPIEGNFNQGRAKQHGHYFNSFLIGLCSPVRD